MSDLIAEGIVRDEEELDRFVRSRTSVASLIFHLILIFAL